MRIRKWLLPLLVMAPVSLPLARSVTIIDGGRLHLQGMLVNGACAVAPQSRHMSVEMGHYRSNFFSDVGSYAPLSVPFSVRLTGCRPDVLRSVGIIFNGETPGEDPQVFLAATRVNGRDISSGIGLALFDAGRQLIIPGVQSLVTSRDNVLHFIARYRAVSREIMPGQVHSTLWFTLVYP
jgi:fimbrial protein